MFQEIMLVAAVCMDMFFTAFSYGQNGIKVPAASAFAVSLTGAAILTLSLWLSETVGKYIPENLCRYSGAAILFIIGSVYLMKNVVIKFLKKYENCNEQIKIFIDECNADKDNSKVLSVGEAFLLSVSLSIDSLASGIGAGLTGSMALRTGLIALVGGFGVMISGGFLGGRLKLKTQGNYSWAGGLILIILAVTKII